MKILFITLLSEKFQKNSTFVNYIVSDMILHGFKEVYGNDVIYFPGAWYMYTDEQKKRSLGSKKLWGNGFNYYDSYNNYNTFEYNDFNATISINNFVTKFNFIEEHGETGDANILANTTSYSFDEKNSFKFQTRRNRKLNLTEYYYLVYEYRNDCLTAGIKYKKSYYADGDLQPTENLLFTITLFPLTTYEYQANEILGQ